MHSDLTPKELEDAYENGAYIPNGADYREAWPRHAKTFREAHSGVFGNSYDATPGAIYDLFPAEGTAKGTMIFVHGGYWRAFGPSDWSWVARAALSKGWNVALIGYPLAPSAKISQMTRLVRLGIETVAGELSGPIVLTGHSAGGHLVARMAMADGPRALWPRIEKIVPISPVADLRSLLRHPMNETLQLTNAEAEAESPTLHAKVWDGELETWVGGAERPAFLDQAHALHDAWGGSLTVPPDRHHFDILEELADPEGAIAQRLF